MGFLKRIFGKGSKDDDPKISLIKSLIKNRLPFHENEIDSTPPAMLMGTPEATLVTIVETYWHFKIQGHNDETIFDAIESHRAKFEPAPSGVSHPVSLNNYVKYRLRLEHEPTVEMTDDLVETCIQESNKFFAGKI
jgi:hypothetical protein